MEFKSMYTDLLIQWWETAAIEAKNAPTPELAETWIESMKQCKKELYKINNEIYKKDLTEESNINTMKQAGE